MMNLPQDRPDPNDGLWHAANTTGIVAALHQMMKSAGVDRVTVPLGSVMPEIKDQFVIFRKIGESGDGEVAEFRLVGPDELTSDPNLLMEMLGSLVDRAEHFHAGRADAEERAHRERTGLLHIPETTGSNSAGKFQNRQLGGG